MLSELRPASLFVPRTVAGSGRLGTLSYRETAESDLPPFVARFRVDETTGTGPGTPLADIRAALRDHTVLLRLLAGLMYTTPLFNI